VAKIDISAVKFLIVEDNPFMRIILKQLLRALGVLEMAEAADGAQAFSVMKIFEPDIILIDWEMQPLDGLDFVKLVRVGDDSPNQYVPMIMVTGHSEQNKVTQARDAGINEMLIKPLSARTLFSRIRAVIERPRPFVETRGYFGPDRRRKQEDFYSGPERRKDPDEQSQSDVDAMFD
jgi:DNA-binding response OmpR family regulator